MRGRTRFGLDGDIAPIVSVVMFGGIMTILDTTIVNVAIDRLGRTFHAPLSTVQWVTTGYLLALAVVVPLTGWAADRFGSRRVWIVSLALFVLGSAMCGLAWSLGSLIAFRVLQGLGGGMIMPTSQAILARAAGPERMGRVMAVVGVPTLLGPILGPLLGGLIVTTVSWRWIFLVNVPFGILALALARTRLPQARPNPSERLDWVGFALLSPGMALVVYGLSAAGVNGGLGDTPALVTMTTGAALIASFVLHSARRGTSALIDVSLFRIRGFSPAIATNALFAMSLYGFMILIPLYFQIVQGDTAFEAGLMMVPQGIGAAIAMPYAGVLTDRYGARRIVPVGLAVNLAATFVFTQVGPDTPHLFLGCALFVRGLGLGCAMSTALAAVYAVLPRDALSRGTAAMNATRQLGASLGTALTAVALERQIHAQLPDLKGHGLAALHEIPAGVNAAAKLATAFGNAYWSVFLTAAATLLVSPRLPSGLRTASRAAIPGAGWSRWQRRRRRAR